MRKNFINDTVNYAASWSLLEKMLVFIHYFLLIAFFSSCSEDGLTDVDNNYAFSERLSEYKIFKGSPADLKPMAEFHPYNLNTELFSDYALKQRLIRIPAGKKILTKDDGLLDFPDSTILVKTFFYLNDTRDTSKGRRIVETRLLVRHAGRWNVATYIWNESQTDASLINSGFNSTIHWINERGDPQVISYHVPSARECVTCHSKDDITVPIGPKIRNLHRTININSIQTDQLTHWENIGLLKSPGAAGDTLPDWQDESKKLEERVRAYVDVNCGHCHQPGGVAAQMKVFLDFDHTRNGTIEQRKDMIFEQMRRGRMPQIGTTLVHAEGVEMIRAYIKSLK